MSTEGLNLFPTRIEIGQFEAPGGKQVKVYASPEFSRALAKLLERVGGQHGLDATSLAVLASFDPVVDVAPTFGDIEISSAASEVVALRDQLAEVTAQLDGVLCAVAPLVQRVEALEAQLQLSDTGTDWEHPGKIGFRTSNTGAFTVLSTGAGTVAAPSFYLGTDTGTGLYRIGANNLGLSINGTKLLDFSSAVMALTGDGTVSGTFVVTGGFQGATVTSVGAATIGGLMTAASGLFTGNATVGGVLSVTGNLGVGGNATIVGRFGCNGSASQPRYPIGAAATDLPSVVILANNMRILLNQNGQAS